MSVPFECCTDSNSGSVSVIRIWDIALAHLFCKTHLNLKHGLPTKSLSYVRFNENASNKNKEDLLIVNLPPCPELHIHSGLFNVNKYLHHLEKISLTLKTINEPTHKWIDLWEQSFYRAFGFKSIQYLLDCKEKRIQGLSNSPYDLEGYQFLQPYRVVLVGPPNVGKSSLFNSILGKTKALVSNISGTTRDALSAQIEINGYDVELTDTAGIYECEKDIIQKESIRLSYQLLEHAELILFLDLPENLEKKFHPKTIFIHSKADLYETSKEVELAVSIFDKSSIDRLIEIIAEHVTKKKSGNVSLNFHSDIL